MDICLNFMERWMKQAGKLHRADMRHLDDHGDIRLPEGFEVFTVRPANIFPSVCPCSPLEVCTSMQSPESPYTHFAAISACQQVRTHTAANRPPTKQGWRRVGNVQEVVVWLRALGSSR
jgi:hypothetical protein